jgi:pimeloyl-ACP methyl ester carboxylesterase
VSSCTVEANGLRFALLQEGPDEGPLALCLHGFPDTPFTWRRLLPELAARGFRAVAPFMRGYAPSEVRADVSYGVHELGTDCNELHELLGGGRAGVLIGHDWGAAAVYAALAQVPSRWAAAVSVSVPPTGHIALDLASIEQMRRSWYGFLMQLPVAEEVVAANGFELLDRLWADWSPGFEAAEDLERVKELFRMPGSLLAAIRYYRDTPSTLREPSADDVLPDVPLLYLHGADDGCIGADVVELARPFFPTGAEIRILEGAGHFLQLERPTEFNSAVLAFLDRTVPRP